jgi:hypothetical protein
MVLNDAYFLIRGGLYLAACEFLYRIYSRPRGPQEVFRVSWAYHGLAWISVVASSYFFWQIAAGHASSALNDIWSWVFFLSAVILLIQFPSVVTVDEAGIERRSFLGRRERILWSDVIAVKQKWEESPLDPFFSGQRAALMGKDGTKICFSEWNVKQDRFEWWIRNRVPAQRFVSIPPKPIIGNWPLGQ